MKKLLIIGLFGLLLFTSGCFDTQPNDDQDLPIIDHSKVNEVVNLINILHLTITEDDRENIELIRSKYNQLTQEEQALVYNYDTFEYAEAELAALEEEQKAQEERDQLYMDTLLDIENYLRDLIPARIAENIELPREYYTLLGDATITWFTSDPLTITNRGVVNQGRKDINIELSGTIRLEEYSHTFLFNVVVEPIEFDPLPQENLAFAYTFNSGHGFSELELETLNVVNHCFATINPDEYVVSALALSDRENILALRKQGIRVVFSILGYGPETPTRPDSATRFSEAARTPQGRFKFAQSIVETVIKYHYDGVDVDWEYPGLGAAPGIDQATDTNNYTLLIQEIHRQLKAVDPDYLLTAAVPGGRWNPSRYDIASINQYLDYFHLMTYGMDSSNTTTHHTGLYASEYSILGSSVKETVDLYLQGGASPEKLVIGAAFYGREFTLENPNGNIMRASANRRSITYSVIHSNYLSRIDSGEVIRYWDDDAKAPYLHDTKNNIVIVYEDYESIKYKIEYLKAEGLGGIMFWQYQQDNTRTLMQSIHDHLRK